MNAGAAAGLVVMAGSEAATLAGIEPFASWNTPICWTGFILFADSLVFKARGHSWLRSAPGEFLFLAVASIPLWLVFEWFNLFIRNWHYVGLPENLALRYFGYAWSFATISPAIFEGAELIGVWRGGYAPPAPAGRVNTGRPVHRRSERGGGDSAAAPPAAWSALAIGSIALGSGLLLWPIIRPSPYLAAPVWLGFIFLLDPINDRLGQESLLADARAGRSDRTVNLLLSGLLCGALWEFWNFWARAKWHYTVPIMEDLKIFEMPLPGYLGFPAFALECFTMYVALRYVVVRLSGASFRRPIGV